MNTRIESTKYVGFGEVLKQLESINHFTNIKSEDGDGKIDAYLGFGLELFDDENYSKTYHRIVEHIIASTNAAVLSILAAGDSDVSDLNVETEIKVSDDYEHAEMDDKQTKIIPIVVHTTIESCKIDNVDTHEVERAMNITLLAVDMYMDDPLFIGYYTSDPVGEVMNEISKKVVSEAVEKFFENDEDEE